MLWTKASHGALPILWAGWEQPWVADGKKQNPQNLTPFYLLSLRWGSLGLKRGRALFVTIVTHAQCHQQSGVIGGLSAASGCLSHKS